MLDPGFGGPLLDLVAGKEEPALVFLIRHAPGAADEHLLDSRHRALRFLAQDPEIDGHFAPAEQEEVPFRDDLLRDRLGARLGVGVIVRQKDEADPEVALLEELVAEPLHLRHQDLVGDLRHDARAVAGLRIGIHGAAMGQMAERLDAVSQHLVGAFSMDGSDEPDPAGVVFEFG